MQHMRPYGHTPKRQRFTTVGIVGVLIWGLFVAGAAGAQPSSEARPPFQYKERPAPDRLTLKRERDPFFAPNRDWQPPGYGRSRQALTFSLFYARRANFGETGSGGGLAARYWLGSADLPLLYAVPNISLFWSGGVLSLPVGLDLSVGGPDWFSASVGSGVFVVGGRGRPGHESTGLAANPYLSLRLSVFVLGFEYRREYRTRRSDLSVSDVAAAASGRTVDHLFVMLSLPSPNFWPIPYPNSEKRTREDCEALKKWESAD